MLLVERIVVVGADSLSNISITVYAMIAFWGIRLAYHIGKRYKGEDVRYVELLKLDKQCSKPCYVFLVWFRNFFFQGAVNTIV